MTDQSRSLTAIMFTDIVGYTSLMEQDEAKAIEVRERHREIVGVLVKQFQGTVVDKTGDEILTTFPNGQPFQRLLPEHRLVISHDRHFRRTTIRDPQVSRPSLSLPRPATHPCVRSSELHPKAQGDCPDRSGLPVCPDQRTREVPC